MDSVPVGTEHRSVRRAEGLQETYREGVKDAIDVRALFDKEPCNNVDEVLLEVGVGKKLSWHL